MDTPVKAISPDLTIPRPRAIRVVIGSARALGSLIAWLHRGFWSDSVDRGIGMGITVFFSMIACGAFWGVPILRMLTLVLPLFALEVCVVNLLLALPSVVVEIFRAIPWAIAGIARFIKSEIDDRTPRL